MGYRRQRADDRLGESPPWCIQEPLIVRDRDGSSGGSRISGKGGAGWRVPEGHEGRGEGVSSPVGWGLRRGCAPRQKNFEI